MICHATGDKPNKAYPRRNFIFLVTPLGPLWFRDRETCESWVDRLSPRAQEFLNMGKDEPIPGVISTGVLYTDSQS